MALKSTIFRADVVISDLQRNYYQKHSVTLARHPSETDERMMMRMLAFILNASDNLAFAQGLTSSDEPDLWEKDFTGAVSNWVMVGLPDEKYIKKACSRSQHVIIYSYGGSAAEQWWTNIKNIAHKFDHLSIFNINQSDSSALTNLTERTMKLDALFQDNILWLSNAHHRIEVNLEILKYGN